MQAHIAGMLTAGSEPNTARLRLASLRAYARWLAAEGEINDDPLTGLRPPKLTTKVVTEALTDDDLRLLLKACRGPSFKDRRDEALVRLLAETGLRAAEVIALQTTDLDLSRGLVTVRKGKGGKGRVVPIGPHTAAAIDRYSRARRSHRLAEHCGAVARCGRQGIWLPRAQRRAAGAGPRRRYRRLPPASDAAHRGYPLAAGRRLVSRV